MNLQQCLDMLKNNILYDRSDRVAGTPDYLWSDETLITYINEAQRRFARLGLLIRDGSTPDVTQVTLTAGVNFYALDPSVLAVMSVRYPGDNADLARGGHNAFDTYRKPDPYWFDPSMMEQRGPGKPLAYSTDEYLSPDDYDSASVVTLRIYPVPDSLQTGKVLQMRVVRLPLDDLTSANMQAVPEIPRDHHLEMLDWAAYLALRIVDVDAGMPALADKFRASFDDAVTKARNNLLRKEFAPAQWSFGRDSFSWERD
jgi:hypothetical protein